MLLSLIKHHQLDIDKIYIYIKGPFKSKYQFLVNGWEKVGTESLKNPKAFIDYSQIVNVYENLEDYNQKKKRRVLKVADDMIGEKESNKRLSPIVNELLLRGRKLFPQDSEILGWCPARPVLPHGEKVPL